jgi:hypothetical protein
LLSKLPNEQWNELYKYMYNMLEEVTEKDFNEVYEDSRLHIQVMRVY